MPSPIEITVAICVFNCEKYIEETLGCIMAQTFQDFDLLIVNDCSSDSTRNRIVSFFKSHPRPYQLVDFVDNRGLAVGRHYVENHVDTKYLLFVDADDLPYPTMIEKLYNKITSDEDLMAVGCYLEFIDNNGKRLRGGQFLGDKTKEEFYERAKNNKLIFLASNSIFKREIAITVGGRAIEGFFNGRPRFQDLCEDLDLWTRMSDLYTQNKAIVVLPEILLKYRKYEQSLSASSFNMILRMRHIKMNLLQRRQGKPELSFIEFYNSLSVKEMTDFKYNARAIDNLRNGMFLLKRKKVLAAISNITCAVWSDPEYFWQKIKYNSGIFK